MLMLQNEFAQVGVDLDESGNGPRLRIHDFRTGHVGYLDPLELESLAWATKEELSPLLDPARTRWKVLGAEELADLADMDSALPSRAPK